MADNSAPPSPTDLKALFANTKKQKKPDPPLDLSGLEEKVDKLKKDTVKIDQKKLKQLEETKQEEEQITQYNDQIDQTNPQLVSSRNKEALVGGSGETVRYQERSAEFEPNGEIAEFVQAAPIENLTKDPTPVEDDFGKIILQASRVPRPNITLPINQDQMEENLKFNHKVVNSVTWLAQWCKRNILLAPKRVFFPESIQKDKK